MVDLLKVKWENDHELINHDGFLGHTIGFWVYSIF